MALKTNPIEGGIGAEVINFDLSDFDRDSADDILTAISRFGLLLFRRQSLTDHHLYEMSKGLGKVEIPANSSSRSPGFQEVLYISNLHTADGAPIGGSTPGTRGGWHSDQAFRKSPATLSTLFCVIAPETGGGTSFCSKERGYQSLSDAKKQELKDLRGQYMPGKSHDVEKIEVTHAAVLKCPQTERKTLYVSPSTRGFEGMSEVSSDALKEELLGYQLREEHQYTHNWRMGDMLIYDNAQFLHRREAYDGFRFLKATRVFADPAMFAVPN